MTIEITKEFLIKKYVEEELTQEEIAKLCNCSRKRISNHLNKFNIATKNLREYRNPNARYDLLDNKEWLYQKYVEEEISTVKIANICNCRDHTVGRYLKKHDIKTRDLRDYRNPNARYDLLDDKNWLYKKYIKDKLTTVEIAKLCKCNASFVSVKLKEFGIATRQMGEYLSPNAKWNLLEDRNWLYKKYIEEKLSLKRIAELCNCKEKPVVRKLKEFNIKIRKKNSNEATNPYAKWNLLEDKGWLYKKYKIKKHSSIEIASFCKCSDTCVLEYLKKFNIPIRDNKGKNSHFWKGGISFEPYCNKWTASLKEKIRNRNDRVCYICGKLEEDDNRKLSVHHVDYNKMQGCEDNIQGKKHKFNLVPLCTSCHSRTNHNRYYWFNLLYNNWIFNEEINFHTPIYYPQI